MPTFLLKLYSDNYVYVLHVFYYLILITSSGNALAMLCR